MGFVKRWYLLEDKRKRLRLFLTVCVAILTPLMFGACELKGVRIQEYRLIDLVAAPIYAFFAGSQLILEKSMDEIWLEISAGIVIAAFAIFSFVGFIFAIYDSVLFLLVLGIVLGLVATFVIEEMWNANGFLRVATLGCGFGGGLHFGFLYGFVVWGLVALGAYFGSPRAPKAFMRRIWHPARTFFGN